MDISNSLYYTFSTISQVLAAFIALSGVFVIFKIQEFKKIQFIQVQHFYSYLNGVKGLFIGSFHGCPTIAVTLKTLHQSECLGGMQDEMEKILKDTNVKESPEFISLNKMKSIFDNVDLVRSRIIKLTKLSIVSGLTTILFSLVILVFVPYIKPNIGVVLYILGFSGLVLSIGTMMKVIFSSVNEKNFLIIKKPSS